MENNNETEMINHMSEMMERKVHVDTMELVLAQIYRLFLILVLSVIAFALMRLATALRTTRVRERVNRHQAAHRSVELLLELERRGRSQNENQTEQQVTQDIQEAKQSECPASSDGLELQ